MGKKGRNLLQTKKTQDFENHPLGLSCLSLHTNIWCCHQLLKLTNKNNVWPSVEQTRALEDAWHVWNQNYFFVFWFVWIALMLKSQWMQTINAGCTRSKFCQTERITVLAMVQTTRVALVKASKNKANLATDEVRMESQNHGLAWLERVITKQWQFKSYYQSIIA